jgi:hypothetical protein
MDAASIITLILSFLFSLVTAYFVSQREIEKLHLENKIRIEEEAKKYWQPILKSAADLQDRLWHLTQHEVTKGKDHLSVLDQIDESKIDNPKWPMTKKEYLTSTLFYFAQYFAWVEILRQKTQFIDVGKDDDTRNFHTVLKDIEIGLSNTVIQWKLMELGTAPWVIEGNLLKENTNAIQSDRPLFRFQQAAIGQLLIKNGQDGVTCVNYLEFQNLYDSTLKNQVDFECLRDLIVRAVNHDPSDFCQARCCILANQLIDMMKLLDPDKKFVFSSERSYVEIPGYTKKSGLDPAG